MAKLDYAKGEGYGLSYSRLSTLHSCPRKFELENVLGLSRRENSVTFAYGHVVGAGIQSYFQGHSLERALVLSATFWDMPDFWDEGTSKEIRAKKNFWTAIQAIESFYKLMEGNTELSRKLKGYRLAKFKNDSGKEVDGVELTFHIKMTGTEYIYEGHIDVVLYNEELDEYLILELKTTSFSNIHAAQYQNSNQALGYSVVLDKIAGNFNANSAYHVLYLVYSTSKKEFTTFNFPKSVMQRSNWLRSLQYDIAQIEMYREHGLPFPTNGASCYDFFRPCSYLENCNYTNETLESFKPKTEDEETFSEMEEADFTFEFDDLAERQQELLSQRIDIVQVEDSTGEELDIDELFS